MWDAIVNAMVKLFNGLHQFIVGLGVPAEREGLSYILAILIFTVIIRLLILPLNIKSTKSNARMQEIQPEMKKLQAKYKNDPQKLQLETKYVWWLFTNIITTTNIICFISCIL